MKKWFVAAAALAVSMLAAAPAASAATVIGDQCVANKAESNVVFFEFSAPGNPLPTAAPSSGVITQWGVNLVPAPVTIPTVLKVLRLQSPTQLTVIGESTGNVVAGVNSFPVRIPVQAGDRIGIYGPGEIGTLICEAAPEKTHLGGFLPVGLGATTNYEQGETEFRVPVTATIEPDVDGDGYGDETQDKCPQSAAFQIPCPVITVDSVSVVGKTKVIVYVATSNEAPVNVGGTVNLGKGKTTKLSGGTQTVLPGNIAHFTLKFSKALKAKLKELPASKKLTLQVTASATNVAGQVSTDVSKTKLKGQG